MTWVPTNDFEEEIVSMQPEYNFIFGNNIATTTAEAFYPRPSAHLQFAATQKKLRKQQQRQLQSGGESKTSAHSQKLSVIGKVQRIAGTKPLGEQPTINDWDTPDNIERETVAMMRHCGLGPSIEEPLDERCTIATLPITEDVRIMHNGQRRMPIFFDEKFFKLKPRVSNSSSGVDSASTTTPNGSTSSANNSFVSAASGSSVRTDASSDANVATIAYHATCLPARDAEMNYEKLPNIKNDSSESLSCFVSATEETPNSSKQFIPSYSWYRSGADGSNKNASRQPSSSSGKNKSNNNSKQSWRSGSSSSLSSPASSSSTSSHHSYTPPQRFFTARELYERKRHN